MTTRLTRRDGQFDHPSARVHESHHGRSVSGPPENERAPRATGPPARTRNEQPRHSTLRWLTTILLAELALSFAAVAVYFLVGPDPTRAVAPVAVTAFFVWAAYVVTVDS